MVTSDWKKASFEDKLYFYTLAFLVLLLMGVFSLFAITLIIEFFNDPVLVSIWLGIIGFGILIIYGLGRFIYNISIKGS